MSDWQSLNYLTNITPQKADLDPGAWARLEDQERNLIKAKGVDAVYVQMLAPGEKKTYRAYIWTYSTTPFSALNAVVYDFSPSRAGEHAHTFLMG
ncbi:DNA/RNA endonuclease G (NUC1) [Pseudomonas laurylsulfatiphila]